MEFGENSQKLVYGSKFNELIATFLCERTLIGTFSEHMTDRPIFGRINQNFADKIHKPTNEKSKIIKKWFFQKIDSKGVSWWILVQKRLTTPKVLIFDDKNSSHEELIQHQFFEKSTFLIFFECYVFRKVILRRIQCKNYHLKVLPMSSWDFSDLCILHHKRIYNDA